MPMEDATASDNAVVTIECQRNHRWRCRRQLRDRSHLHCNRRRGSSSSAATVEDTTAPEFTFVPADYTVECSDEMPMDAASDNW